MAKSKDLKPVVWRHGAGKMRDAKGKELKGGDTGYFPPERADRLVTQTLADPYTDTTPDEEPSDGNHGLRSDGGGSAGEAAAVERPDGDDQAGVDD